MKPQHAWMQDRSLHRGGVVQAFNEREVAWIRLKYWTGYTAEWIAQQFGKGVDAVTVKFVAENYDSVYRKAS